MRILVIVAGLIVFGFVVMVAYLYLNQRKMLYFPLPLNRDLDHVKENESFEVKFIRDGTSLHGWLINPDRSKLIIYYGGNAEELSYNIEGFKRLEEFSTLLVNYRGFGESGGTQSEKDLVADALTIIREMKGRYSSIVLMGRSLGSGIAVQVAGQVNVDGLILVTPYDSIRAVGQGMYPLMPVSWLIKDPYDSIEASKRVTAPALFLIAEDDEVIPGKHSRNLADSWSSTLEWVLIEEADHNSITEFRKYWQAIQEFLREQ